MATKKAKKKRPKNGSPGAPAGAASADEKPIEKARYEERLQCDVPLDSLPERASELARVIREHEETLERKREANSKFRERITFLRERMTELSHQVEQRKEHRNVLCIEYLIPRTREIQIVRQDTGEVVDRHAAGPEDLQEELPLPEDEKKKSEDDDSADAPE